MWCGGVDGRRSSLRRQPLPWALWSREWTAQLPVLAHTFADEKRFKQEVFFITEQDKQAEVVPGPHMQQVM